MKKMSKRESFETLRSFVAGAELGATGDELVAFIDHELELIAQKAAKSKLYSAKKAVKADTIMDTVAAVLGDEPMSIDEVTKAIGDVTLTRAKVSYRLAQLVKTDRAVASERSIKEDGKATRKIKVYRMA